MAERTDIEKGPFRGTWESLLGYECPDWFRDAKLGIWAHWGPQSVPMFGDWYARHMYVEGHDQYRHHWRTYGHPSQHGFKDVAKLWKAEKFDADYLMGLYVAAGAKYFVAQAVHHDNFAYWDSAHNPWNATKVGPMQDIVGVWAEAARKRGLRFGLTEHLAASFAWFSFNKGADKTGPYAGVPYDGTDPAFESLYYPNQEEYEKEHKPWVTENAWFKQHWFDRIKDLVDKYEPDLLYSDSGLPFEENGLGVVAHLYNLSAKRHGGTNQAVYNQKSLTKSGSLTGDDEQIFTIGVLDIERGGQPDIFPYPWQTDTCVGGWFYDVRQVYKTPTHVIEMLVDIVSKNGNLLLNFTQKPDGTLDDECVFILKKMAGWIAVNGEGIYSTRPWSIAGEGPTTSQGGAFKEDALAWTSQDYRFTAKGSSVYAFQMRWPEDGKSVIKSLGCGQGTYIKGVSLLGFDGTLAFSQEEDGLHVLLPEKSPCDFVHCLRLELA